MFFTYFWIYFSMTAVFCHQAKSFWNENKCEFFTPYYFLHHFFMAPWCFAQIGKQTEKFAIFRRAPRYGSVFWLKSSSRQIWVDLAIFLAHQKKFQFYAATFKRFFNWETAIYFPAWHLEFTTKTLSAAFWVPFESDWQNCNQYVCQPWFQFFQLGSKIASAVLLPKGEI